MTRLWVERSVGFPLNTGARLFPGVKHEFQDITFRPMPTIDARPRTAMIIEYFAEAEPMDDPNKPPYRVPSMNEIAAIPWNGFTVASTFSGAGGSSLGYRMAGFKVLWANEFIDAAREVYAANKAPHTILDGRDIRIVKPEDILSATGLQAGQLDLLDGSPPCSSFSSSGRREAGWGKSKAYSDKAQRTDDLFYEFVRILRGVQPKVFIAENVSGLVKGTAKGHFLEILSALKGCGYRVEAKLLDAQWLGVPQARQRLIFQGVRNDIGVAPVYPTPLRYRYTVRDALPHILQPGGRLHDEGFPIEPECDLGTYAIGKEWDKVAPGNASKKFFSLKKAHLDRPSQTIPAVGATPGLATVTHPTERRKFSIAELKRLCAFPDDFALSGTYTQRWERLGRAVPPVMMFHIAEAIRDNVLLKQNIGTSHGPAHSSDSDHPPDPDRHPPAVRRGRTPAHGNRRAGKQPYPHAPD